MDSYNDNYYLSFIYLVDMVTKEIHEGASTGSIITKQNMHF